MTGVYFDFSECVPNFAYSEMIALFYTKAKDIFFKENVRNPVWICRDSISLILGTRFSLILGTR